MHRKLYLLTALCCSALVPRGTAQTAADYAIQLQATVQTAPPKVTLNWRKIPGATQYNLQRKTKEALVWTTLATTTDTFYADPTVVSDSAFEYKVTNTGGSTSAAGYVMAGLNAAPLHSKGRLILIVDTLFRDSCAAEVTALMKDLSADGWAIVRHNVPRTLNDVGVKTLIKNDYVALPDVKAVFLLGHVAVPYSGELNPDGHPDHLGAWPADVFYGDMDGIWTDVSVNNSSASRTQNKNIPGDGKWDHSGIPSYLELQVGRVDFANMPLFAKSEVALMKSYLAKAHRYKMDSLYVSRKGIVDDNFGAFSGEAFAANAWRNFAPIVGRDNVSAKDFISSLNDSAYQWAMGCGGGSYTSCSGVGITGDFVSKNQKGIFTMLFGSYFGDWDSQNNFLRAPLCCSEPALTSCWAGRPNWFFHHMGLGEHIGYSTITSQNYTGSTYNPAGYAATGVHAALMGDLSLRNQYIMPARNITVTTAPKKGATVNWTASGDATVLGYYVYRADSLYGTYTKRSGLITGTTFTDTAGKDGLHYYMVRPCKLQAGPSGTYYNLGLGITDSATISYPDPVSVATQVRPAFRMLCFPNPARDILNIYGETDGSEDNLRLTISDVTGKTLLQRNLPGKQAEFTVSEDITHLVPGVYFIQLHSDKGMEAVQKIIRE